MTKDFSFPSDRFAKEYKREYSSDHLKNKKVQILFSALLIL